MSLRCSWLLSCEAQWLHRSPCSEHVTCNICTVHAITQCSANRLCLKHLGWRSVGEQPLSGIAVLCAPSSLRTSKQNRLTTGSRCRIFPTITSLRASDKSVFGFATCQTSDFKDCCLGRWLVSRLKTIIKGRREFSAIERRDWSARGSGFSSSQGWWLSTVCSSSSV